MSRRSSRVRAASSRSARISARSTCSRSSPRTSSRASTRSSDLGALEHAKPRTLIGGLGLHPTPPVHPNGVRREQHLLDLIRVYRSGEVEALSEAATEALEPLGLVGVLDALGDE